MFARRPADCTLTERRGGKSYEVQLWDTDGLPFSADYRQSVRVVRSAESLTRNHYRRGELTPETTEHEWLRITTLDPQAFPATMVRGLGHDRWKQENNGWNDLTQNWAFKHGFLHACRHRPPTDSPQTEGPPAPAVDTGELVQQETPAVSLVANCGLAAVSLILLLAFTLSMAFTHCHSKLFRRYRMATIEVACQLRRSVSKLPPNIRAPDSPAEPQTA